ncbi:hypothetical protein C1701_22585 [Actinoalloteichus sp. AHMU CJ021]|nr:hypothetical protein C1701_22585 [Actinoalloteichus sp. AHMU CJ021]
MVLGAAVRAGGRSCAPTPPGAAVRRRGWGKVGGGAEDAPASPPAPAGAAALPVDRTGTGYWPSPAVDLIG